MRIASDVADFMETLWRYAVEYLNVGQSREAEAYAKAGSCIARQFSSFSWYVIIVFITVSVLVSWVVTGLGRNQKSVPSSYLSHFVTVFLEHIDFYRVIRFATLLLRLRTTVQDAERLETARAVVDAILSDKKSQHVEQVFY